VKKDLAENKRKKEKHQKPAADYSHLPAYE
jgi:hypothetical protein